jgi:hypothetical protein
VPSGIRCSSADVSVNSCDQINTVSNEVKTNMPLDNQIRSTVEQLVDNKYAKKVLFHSQLLSPSSHTTVFWLVQAFCDFALNLFNGPVALQL